MTILCLVAGHAVAAAELRNQGFEFGACRRCRRDMVRSGRTWRAVPRGFRVVWRGGAPLSPSSGSRSPLGAVPAALDLVVLAGRSLVAALADRWRRWGASAREWRRRGTVLRLPPPAPQPGR